MQAQTHLFDPHLSLRLDRLIVTIEASPRHSSRVLLQLHKRWAERTVPAFGKHELVGGLR